MRNKHILSILMALNLSAATATAIPQPVLVDDGPGLWLNFNDGTAGFADYGKQEWWQDSLWDFSGASARSVTDMSFGRIRTSLKGDYGNATAMSATEDWVLSLEWTNNVATDTTIFEAMSENNDIVKFKGMGSNRFQLDGGNGTGDYVGLWSGTLSPGKERTLTLHYEAAGGLLDFYIDDDRVAANFPSRSGRYDFEHLQILGGLHSPAGEVLDDIMVGPLGDPTSRQRGRNWVRSHPIYLSALLQITSVFSTAEYRNAGLNTLFPWKLRDEFYFQQAADAGMAWQFHLHHERYGRNPQEVVATMRQYVEAYPGCTGFQYSDEPEVAEMPAWAPYIAALKEAFPDKLVYCNAFGSRSESYYDDFCRILQPDVLMYDIYPFWDGGGTASDYFEKMMRVRNAARRYDIPYWAYLQSFGPEFARRLPSESDMRMQVYSSLAAGFTGFCYFTYDAAYVTGLVDSEGDPSPMYPHAAGLNAEVAALGQTLRLMESTDVRFVPGQGNATPSGLRNWSPGAGGDPYIVAVSSGGDASREDGLIGFFTDDDGNRFFMLVNLNHGKERSAAATSLEFRIEFDPSIEFLIRLNRETGQQEPVFLQDHALDLLLPGGTGDLFGYGLFPLLAPGDANTDGVVDDDDLSLLLANWTGVGGTGSTWRTGDFDGNGAVSDSDLSLLLAHWTGPLDGVIPEPATVAILAVGVLAVGRDRRRARRDGRQWTSGAVATV